MGIKLKIVTPDGTIYQDTDIKSITIPTKTGIITIMEDHIPLVSLLQPGEINVEKSDHTVDLAISSGIVEIYQESEVYILAETAERAEKIDLERAEEARKRAEEYLAKQEILDDIDFAKFQALIEKEIARINTAKKYKNIRKKYTK